NLEEATAIKKAIALLRQAIGSSPGENTGTSKLESIRESAQDRDAGLGGSRFRNFTKKESMKKAFQDMLYGLRGS
nr:hypothetical protein [Tanacetum cinerariifolium]